MPNGLKKQDYLDTMKNVILLAALLLAPLVTLCAADTLSATAPSSAVKKGAAGQAKDAGSLYLESGVSWTYNWHPAPSSAMPAGVEFVPMIWGKRDIPEIEAVEKKDGVLLGFNEPEREKQANLTVEEALDLWPKLEATKLRLGSPAPAGGGARPGGWLDRFMAGSKERGYRVDFICLHWYGENYNPEVATKFLKSYLTAVHDRFQKPIWLTEFALKNYKNNAAPATVAEQQQFMLKALPMLEKLPFVERYSWFVFNSNRKAKTDSWYLLDSSGQLSELGKTYAATAHSPK